MSHKIAALDHFLNEHNPHIAVITEHGMTKEELKLCQFNNHVIINEYNTSICKGGGVLISDGQNRVILRIDSFVFEYFENRDQYSNTEYNNATKFKQ